MNIHDAKIHEEKVIILTEESLLESLHLDSENWKLSEAYDDFPKRRVIIKIVQNPYYNDYDFENGE